MKRAVPLILALAALAVLLLVAPGAIGWLLARDADARIDRTLEQASFASVAEHRYHRGWFSSDETITLELFKGVPQEGATDGAPGAMGLTPLRVSVHNTIHHGPFPALSGIGLARIDTELARPPGAADPPPSKVPLTPLTVQTTLGFLGGATTEIRHAAIPQTDLGQGWHFAADAVDFTIRHGRHGDSIDVDGTAPHVLVANDDGARLELSGLQASVHSTRARRSIFVGRSELVLGDLDARFPRGHGDEPTAAAAPDPNDPGAAGAGAGDFSLRALKVTGKSEAAGDFFSGGATISAMYAGAGAYHAQGLKIDAGFEHLQLDAFERLTAGMRRIQRQHSGQPAEQTPELQELWASAGVPLLVNDPALVIRNFQFASAGGFAMLSGSLRIRGATDADFRPTLNVGSLIGKVTADVDIAIDEPLAERLLAPKPAAGAATTRPAGPPPLQAFVTQGYLIDDHGRLRSKLHFANGKLTLNGQPFSPNRPSAPGAGARQ